MQRNSVHPLDSPPPPPKKIHYTCTLKYKQELSFMANEHDNRTRTKNSRSFERSEIKSISLQFKEYLNIL